MAIWRHTAGTLTLLDTLCIPIYPCPDAAYAEACGAAHAVVLAAKYFAEVRPQRIVIKGDNRPVIDFLNNVGKLRRSDLQSLLDTAQHLMAFSLPPLIWSYTPREFNRCADFLAGIARDHAREHFAHAPEHMSSLSPFPFPLPPSLSSLFAPVFNPSPSPSTPHFTFTEVPSLSLPLLPLLFRRFKLLLLFVTFVLLVIYGRVPCSPCLSFIVPPLLIRMVASIAAPSGPKSSLKYSGPCSSVVHTMRSTLRVPITNFSLVLLVPFSNSHYHLSSIFVPSLWRI